MTTPPELPEEPNPFQPPDESAGPMQPPPRDPYAVEQPRRYDGRTIAWTTGIILVVIALASWLFPFVGLLVPVLLLAALLFLIKQNQTVTYRSVLAGVLLGFGLGLLVTAGVCTAVFSGTIDSPLFS